MRSIFIIVMIMATGTVSPLFSSAVKLSAVGGKVGPVLSSIDKENTLSIGLSMDFHNVLPNIIVSPYFEFWSADFKKDQIENWDWQVYALGISAIGLFNLNNSKAIPYVGGGVGFNFNSWSVTFTDNRSPKPRDYEFDLAIHALSGIELPLSAKVNSYLELKFVLAGVTDYFGFWFGLKYKFDTR